MTNGNDSLWGRAEGSKRAVLRARARLAAIAAAMGEPALARRMESELNDAWLRLQLALVTGDAGLIRTERRRCIALVQDAQKAGEVAGGLERRAGRAA